MSGTDYKAIYALLITLFSFFYLSTYYVHDIDIAVNTNYYLTKSTNPFRLSVQNISSLHPSLLLLKESKEIDRGLQVSSSASQLQPPYSKYAYTTLLHGIDDRYRYRGFLYNTIIFKQLLTKYGSKEDVIAMVGYTYGSIDAKFESDIKLLESFGIKVYHLPRMVSTSGKVSFAEMALLKITPFSFTQYEAVQYIDADVMPRKSLDMYFTLKRNSFHSGSASPVNSGWFLAIPNKQHYQALWDLAIRRLENPWDKTLGWGMELPKDLPYRGGHKFVKDWNFNGASLDQGLYTYFFVLTNGNVQIFDPSEVRVYDKNYHVRKSGTRGVLDCCNHRAPVDFFAHFTGRGKPWLKLPSERKGPDVKLWYATLDSLNLPVNSSSLSLQELNSPLGYFHANK